MKENSNCTIGLTALRENFIRIIYLLKNDDTS